MPRYVYDGEDILLEYDGTNTFLARYSHGDQVDQPLILQKGGVGHFYYHSNHQGSITHLTDNSGVVANSYVYGSYGRRLSVVEGVIQPYSYTGREYDDESGLYFYRARYYDQSTGRFLSEDPIGLEARDQNLYRYVFNNPVNSVDPSGQFVVVPFYKDSFEQFTFALVGVPPKVPRMYACNARCATIPTVCPAPNCPEAIIGYGGANNLPEAIRRARADANKKVPAGCSLKHCNYACRGPKGDKIFPKQD